MTKHNKASDDKGCFVEPTNDVVKSWGSITARLTTGTVDYLIGTVSAMRMVAKAEVNDDAARRKGADNYILSFIQLMNAFDTFLKERGKKLGCGIRDPKAGDAKIYDLSNECDATIYLCWKLRNSATHSGNVIDEAGKLDFEKAFASVKKFSGAPRIELPSMIDVGKNFIVKFEWYNIIKECVFDYIGRKIVLKDRDTLKSISSITDVGIEDLVLHYDTENYDILVSMNNLEKAGKIPKAVKGGFILPGECKGFLERNQLIFLDDGVAVPATFIWKGYKKTNE